MSIEEINKPAWRTSDGLEHPTIEAATEHESFLEAGPQIRTYVDSLEHLASDRARMARTSILSDWECWKAKRESLPATPEEETPA